MSAEEDDEGGGRVSRYGDVLLAPGHEIAGKYLVLAILGEGATSIVYTARRKPEARTTTSPAAHEPFESDTETSRDSDLVALKVIHRRLCATPQIAGRFRREADILRRLEGPHVVRVHEAVEEDGALVLVMEHVAGTPLDRRLAEHEPLEVKAAVEIALQVCAGLGTAHAAGVVHRDLKPANVLFSTDGPGDRFLVKVADFGLAKLMQGEKAVSALTEHDMIFGTPEYMAPEQARGDDLDARADIYALGCLLYEMLTGDVPFREGSVMVTMTAHLSKEVVPPRKRRPDGAIPAALEAVVMRALAKAPEDRYPTARAFAEALTAATSTASVVTTTGPADALGDTDLNISVTLTPTGALEATAPGEATEAVTHPDVEPPAPSDTMPFTAGALALQRRGGLSWMWIAIALLAAVAGIGVGIAIGAR